MLHAVLVLAPPHPYWWSVSCSFDLFFSPPLSVDHGVFLILHATFIFFLLFSSSFFYHLLSLIYTHVKKKKKFLIKKEQLFLAFVAVLKY